ncbi:MAG: efflux RND transporter periplasmic adaptor subunit, partial [Myxococcota bacterium]
DVFLEREATLTPIVTTMISAQQEGIIRQISPELGDFVHAGDVLVQIDETDKRLRVAEIRATLRREHVTLAEAERTWKRTEELYRQRVISEEEQGDHRLALERARAEVEEAEARLKREEQELRAHKIVSPFPAVVSQIVSAVGSYVQRGDAILELKNIEWIMALTSVGERDLRHIHEGASARVTVPAFPGRTFEGLIWKIIPDAIVASRSFPVLILLRNEAAELKSGMSARVAFVRQVEDAMLIPKDAVVRERGEDSVWVVQDDRATQRTVELGAAFDDRWHVRSGLAAEDVIVITGNEFLSFGSEVQVVDLPLPGPPRLPAARTESPPAEAGS